MTATTVRRPTEDAALAGAGGHATPLPPLRVLRVGYCSARAVNDRYGLRLFAAAIIRKSQGVTS